MKIMKKLVALILTGIMVFSLAACGQGKTGGSASEEKVSQTEETNVSEQAEGAVEGTTVVKTADLKGGEELEKADSGDSEEEAVEKQAPIVGGWSRAESPVVTDEIKGLIEKAKKDLGGMTCRPIAYIGSQVVAGTNHAVLCGLTADEPNAVTYYAIVTLYEDLNGNVEITQIAKSEAKVESDPKKEGLSGGWYAPESPEVTKDVKAVLEKAVSEKTGVEYKPIALLETQVVAGMNYCILCEVTPAEPNAETGYAIVIIYEDLQGNAELTDEFDFES